MSEEYKVTLPKLGESIMNASIVQWFKKEGEAIKKDEPLLEVATDKVNSEIPSPVAGILKKIHAQPEQEMDVGDLLAEIALEGEGQVETPVEKTEKPAETATTEEMKDYYSPAVLRLARELSISFDQLEKISGTGAGGRITKQDLEKYAQKRKEPCPLAPLPSGEGIELIKMSPLRKAIAENMVQAVKEAPHASLVTEVDVTDLMETIKKQKEAFLQTHGVKLTVTAFVARAIARALKEFPWLNSTVQGDTIVVKHFVNLGIAVSVEGGVMVPVIRGVEKMDLAQIAAEVSAFAKKTRDNILSPDDVKEGTITLTNFGMTGVQIGIPILRFPEVAIIGIGSVVKKAVPQEDDTIGVRSILNISLTFDHRVIDGIYGCSFLSALKMHLEKDLEL